MVYSQELKFIAKQSLRIITKRRNEILVILDESQEV